MADVSLRGVRKSYGSLEVVHGVDLEIASGEFVVFVGPSGCGKSTLLRMIAGLEPISGGDISIGGKVVNDIPSPERGIAMVFQSYALYPHMSVYDNMAFGLKLAKTPKAEVDQRVREAARILQIEDYLDRMPKALSGGQRQRVAIGRAIVRNPRVFLFDEPLSNLDASLRAQTRIEIAKLHDTLDATMIYVTHDQVEAMTLADRIVVLNAGNIEQVGTPLELYSNPVNTFVAGFIASQRMNFLPVSPSVNHLTLPGNRLLTLSTTNLETVRTLGVRPEHLELATDASTAHLSGILSVIEQFGEYALAYVELPDGQLVTIKLDGAPDLTLHDTVHITIPPGVVHLFDDAGRALR
ncbi:maltose ABC transporter ATP-binding protein /trehalose ABC transporter ATP-binding protein /sucrose ABC transporter ATP-binding protein [Devosia sp. YR412]|uniref:ABC transporter ATP-binding protein n=1 Tax=Devosia sp. YR412 TaxID=1881030 RepID=UPI0008B86A7B|nr:sn-glycerol-3-phosphate ABC transporter ATP-binding protein UgpC [Devosia sp. YR412]SEP65573.1 maltose ABC transporter ATP-binding protein /trehalose ABC transporter ATP-binding protein /sucrose ABC transporter ATP-binding protein [Devosia sp. YR412]